MYVECTDCETMMSVTNRTTPFTQECPVCEEPTSWQPAFEGEGVAF